MNKKILLTGGAGFIGHHFVDYILKNTSYDIVTIDRLDYIVLSVSSDGTTGENIQAVMTQAYS